MPGASIFLVKGEALIRLMIVEMLQELGHQVVAEAGSIKVAEPLARSAAFDLAVFDINIAGFFLITEFASMINSALSARPTQEDEGPRVQESNQ